MIPWEEENDDKRSRPTVAAYPAQWNAQSYFGPVLDRRAINEQQLSGHGWFLRALCELFDDPERIFAIAGPELG